jgi:PIN domain nuclease of toxin-antitoxin system
MKKYVLDACALLAFLKKEEGGDVVKNIIDEENEILLHAVNLLEVHYDMVRTLGDDKANNVLNGIMKLPIKIISSTDLALIKIASYFKVNYRVSLGDSFVLASAKLNSASVVTSDRHEFGVVENKESDLEFHWIR